MPLGLENPFLILRIFKKNAPYGLLFPASLRVLCQGVWVEAPESTCVSAVDNGRVVLAVPRPPCGERWPVAVLLSGGIWLGECQIFVTVYALNRGITIELC